jgi:hypothetical protein
MLAAIGCEDPLDARRTVELGATALEVPSDVSAAGPLPGTVTVTLADCLMFERFDIRRSGSTITIRAIGTDAASARLSCPAEVRYEPIPFSVAGPFPRPVTVEVRQPSQVVLRKVVSVRP